MALDYRGLLNDLEQESAHLIAHLRPLEQRTWETSTPAAGWAVRDQISHLAFFDDFAHLAMTDADRFRITSAELVARGEDFPDRVAADHRHRTPTDLLDWFARSRSRLIAEFSKDDPKRRLPWFGPDMSVASSATARLMETWAHGQDVYDTLGVTHPTSNGLRSIAHLGVSTFGFAFRLNGLEVPDAAVRVELQAPDSNETWTWGPETAADHVVGAAEDFVLVVTQRRHLDDTRLTVRGAVAESWMKIAQAYAGAPAGGRPRRMTTARREL
ncbi:MULTISPECIES: TIGR03084 family metal-binding protein [Nocardia]|uniref:TIGR03084 family metal-binding protein n=1 Tax=Nocardia TaxID=1817 RepID=UPI000D68E708|nr:MULTISPECIES: TIGR03084 family metal-binding protein [Nocardia]